MNRIPLENQHAFVIVKVLGHLIEAGVLAEDACAGELSFNSRSTLFQLSF